MLTDRDLNILNWIDNYRAITIEQAQFIFFKGSYEAARKRLGILEHDKIIKSYTSKATRQKVYYNENKISDHDLYCMDYIKELYKLNCTIIDIKIKPRYLNNLIIPDAFVKFKYKGYIFNTLLEVDFTHNTEEDKLNVMYEKLAKDTSEYAEFNNKSFILVIAKVKIQNRYSSKNYDTIYTDLKYSKLKELLELDKIP